MADDHPALQRFVDQAGALYSLPMVAVEILQLTSQPKVDLAALKVCLLRDPALVGKILRVVNSSLFGLSREVSDLNQALALLGTKSVRLLVLGFSLPDDLFVGLAGDILHRYWHHITLKAAAAREISEAIYRIPGEEPFIAGLLQDLGILVLIQQLGEPYVRFLDRAFAKAMDVCQAEAVTLGFDHIQLTSRLLDRWGLPGGLVSAIGVGNSPQRMAQLPSTERALPQILHLADLLAGMLTEGRADWLGELLQIGRIYHHLTETQLRSLVDTLQEKVEQLAGVLSLELPAGLDYRGVFAEAHRRLSLAAEEAAVELSVGLQSNACLPMHQEEVLLDETATLAEAVHRFSQQPQTKSARKTAGQPFATSTSPATAAIANPSAGSSASTETFASSAARLAATVGQIASVEPSTDGPAPANLIWIDRREPAHPANEILTQRLAVAISACRQAREPLSLVLVEIDRFPEMLARRGSQAARRFVQFVGLVCRQIEQPQIVQLQTGESQFALVLADCDRPAAGKIGHDLLDGVRRLCQRHGEIANSRLSVSIGVATAAMPAKNFLPHSLVESAERCLHAAQLSGGNAVKSIDVL